MHIKEIESIFIYFSGHGNNQCIYFEDEILSSSDFTNYFLNKIYKKMKIIMVFDCCKSGSFINSSFLENIYFYLLDTKLLFLSACNATQYTFEKYDKNENKYYGTFTYFFNKIIKKYRQISWSELIYLIKIMTYL